MFGKLLPGLLAAILMASLAGALAIPPEALDEQQIYYGDAASFEKPAEVDYRAVVKATPEYAEIRENKIERGTAKYWILLSNASDHAIKAISQVAQDTDYDLVANQGYLGSLEPAIAAEDVTEQVLEVLQSE
jgi:hypothetical protein